jgi:hypothetical protein
MSLKSEIFDYIDMRLDYVNTKVDRFEILGNTGSKSACIEHAMNIAIKEELLTIKNDLYYTMPWEETE